MTEQVITNLIVAGSALIGAAIGVVGTLLATNRQLRAARRKDNFEIRRADYAERMKALVELRGLTLFPSGQKASEITEENAAKVESFIQSVQKICHCIIATPWAFPEEIGVLGIDLTAALLRYQSAWWSLYSQFRGITMTDEALRELDECAKKAEEPGDLIINTVFELHAISAKTLISTVAEYRELVAKGIE